MRSCLVTRDQRAGIALEGRGRDAGDADADGDARAIVAARQRQLEAAEKHGVPVLDEDALEALLAGAAPDSPDSPA